MKIDNVYFVVLLSLLSTQVFAEKSFLDGDIATAMNQCLVHRDFLDRQDEITCNAYFHHYALPSPNVLDTSKGEDISIGSYNIFKLGDGQTRYKDLDIVVEMYKKWDVVSTTEIMVNDGDAKKVMVNLVKATNATTNKRLNGIYESLDGLNYQDSDGKQIDILTDKDKKKVVAGGILAKRRMIFEKIYWRPIYLVVLVKLREAYPEDNWSLLLTPKKMSNHELAGIYYKASRVRVIETPYCRKIVDQDFTEGEALACMPNLGKYEHVMARKPLIASFKARDFSFSLLGAHLRYRLDEQKEPELAKTVKFEVLGMESDQKVNGLRKLEAVPEGSQLVTDDKYFQWVSDIREKARFAEVKLMAREMGEMKSLPGAPQDIILAADFNLEKEVIHRNSEKTTFDPWAAALRDFSTDAQVYISEKTSVSPNKKAGGKANNYDHFVLDPVVTDECSENGVVQAGVLDFIEETFYATDAGQLFKDRYMGATASQQEAALENFLQIRGNLIQIKRGRASFFKDDEKVYPKQRDALIKRVYSYQNDEKKYYKTHIEVLSDHLPIYLNCSTL